MTSKIRTKTISVIVPEDLYVTLKQRAEINNRSMSGETVHLIESALAEKCETTREFMRLIHRAQNAQ